MKTEIKTLTFIAIAVLMATTTMSIAVHQQMVEAVLSNNQHSHGNRDSSHGNDGNGNDHSNFSVISNSGGKDGGHINTHETCNTSNDKCTSHENRNSPHGNDND